MSADISEDAVLGGRLVLRQPRRGHRVGHDAILLAAAVPARAGELAVDLGAGVGAAGLALARRRDGLAVTLVDHDPALIALARTNVAANDLADRVTVVALDVAASPRAFAAAGLAPGSVDRVLMNPPFNDPARQQSSPDPRRAAAHVAASDTLATWVGVANRLLRPAGTLTLIFRADGLPSVLVALARGFGATAVLPVHARATASAIRVIVTATKASRGPLALLPALVLTEDDGTPTHAADTVLRDGVALSLSDPRAPSPRS